MLWISLDTIKKKYGPCWTSMAGEGFTITGIRLTPSGLLLLDLCNALPLDSSYNPVSVGTLTAGTLLSPALAEQAPLDSTSYQPIGTVPYLDPNWLLQAGGIAAFVAAWTRPDAFSRAYSAFGGLDGFLGNIPQVDRGVKRARFG